MDNNISTFDITQAFAAILDAVETAVVWSQHHGISIQVQDTTVNISFYQLSIALLVIGVVLASLPFWRDYSDIEG